MITTISQEQLLEMMFALRGTTFVSFVSVTVPDLRRSDNDANPNPFIGNIVKVSGVKATLNFFYENSVNNQRAREDMPMDFEAMPRKWGTRLFTADNRLTPLVEHKGQFYLEVKVEESLGHHYETLDGHQIPTEQVERFLKPSYPSRQGVRKTVILRDYKLQNIIGLTYKGQDYMIARAAMAA
jgi:hypothetical protein